VRPLVKLQTINLGADAESVLGEPVIVSQDEAVPDTVEKAFIHDFVRSVDSGWTAEQVRIVYSLAGYMLTHGVPRSGLWN
jgi:hypothetical protein